MLLTTPEWNLKIVWLIFFILYLSLKYADFIKKKVFDCLEVHLFFSTYSNESFSLSMNPDLFHVDISSHLELSQSSYYNSALAEWGHPEWVVTAGFNYLNILITFQISLKDRRFSNPLWYTAGNISEEFPQRQNGFQDVAARTGTSVPSYCNFQREMQPWQNADLLNRVGRIRKASGNAPSYKNYR